MKLQIVLKYILIRHINITNIALLIFGQFPIVALLRNEQILYHTD